MRYIHFRDDFSIQEKFYIDDGNGGKIAIDVPERVEIEFFTACGRNRFKASRNGNEFVNCELSADKKVLTVHVSLRERPIGHGRLLRLVTQITNDPSFPDGLKYTRTPGQENAVLYLGKSDGALDMTSEIVFGLAGVTLEQVWRSLQNNTDYPGATIHIGHIPSLPISSVLNLQETLDELRQAIPSPDEFSIGIGDATISLGGSASLTQIGIPLWAQKASIEFTDMPAMYIGNARMQSSEQTAQDIGGLKNISASGLIKTTNYLQGTRLYLADNVYLEYDAGTRGVKVVNAGVWTESYLTAGGVGSGGGGGGEGASLLEIWRSLTNNPQLVDADITSTLKIAAAHIPNLPWSKITSGKPTSIAGYGITDAYTKAQVDNLIGSINQFHYEIYASTSVVTNPQPNVLYLIGPTGSGSDKYEEYVYANNTWTKIGDTSIDLSPYLKAADAAALYQPIISDLSTIRSRANQGHTVYGYFSDGILGLEHVPLDDRLSYVNPESGDDITIEDDGRTGTVLWGAESANVVSLDVNGVSKMLVKQTALDGINSSITSLSSRIATKQDIISDLSTIRSNASQGATAHGWGDHRKAGYLTSVPTASADTLGLIKVGNGLAINNGVLSVTGQTHGTVTRVDVGSVHYGPDANGVVSLPAYPVVPTAVSAFTNDTGYLTGITSQMVTSALGFTPFNAAYFNRTNIKSTLGISDWALEGNKPIYNFSEINGTAAESQIPSLPYTKITGLGDVVTYNVGSVVSGNGGLVTGGAVYSAINSAISSAIKFQGITTTALTDGSTTRTITIDGKQYTANKGDEVIYGGKEYLWTGSKWQQLGDEESWALKTVTITGTGYLTGGGTLEQNRTIDISASVKSLIDNAVPNTRKVNGHALSSNVTVTKADVGLGSVDNLAASAYFTLLENSGDQVSITIGGTNKKLTVAYASAAGNASTLENHAASYFATAAGLTTLAGRVTSLESRTNWDDYFAVDANGDVYVKMKDETTGRNFYSYGAVTAGGVGSSGGGGGGMDVDRMWQSLQNNPADQGYEDALIAKAHIPDMATTYGYLKGITAAMVTSALGYTPYNKPSSGIPKSDLASAVQTSLGKADTALQSHQTIYALTIKNSEGTAELNYNPASGVGLLNLTKAMVGLGNVENTALSTWTGTDKITTLGTITTGVWNGSKIKQGYLDDIGWDVVRNAATYDTEDYIHVNS